MSDNTSQHIVVFITAPPDKAAELGRALVEARLAACANIVPAIRSIYRWQGELCDDEEALLVIKSRADRLPRLRDKVTALHPYEVPEVIALPIVAGHPPYLSWIDDSCGE